jgi:hypothetical protein
VTDEKYTWADVWRELPGALLYAVFFAFVFVGSAVGLALLFMEIL